MSDELKVFAAPVLRGGRFDDHTIPIDVLPQFITYRDLVKELAKELFRRRHGRIRVPAHFEDAFQLKLQKVEGDCAVPVFARSGDVAPIEQLPEGTDAVTAGDYYDEARDLVSATIAAVAHGRDIPEDFPPEFLEELYALGDYLREDEALELRGPARTAGPVYNALVRLNLRALVTKKTYTKKAELKGTVVGFDWETEHFRLRTLDGHTVSGRHTSATARTLVKALQEKKFTRVSIVGDVQFAPDHAPQKISAILTLHEWSGSDEANVRHVEDRLQELAQLPAGWVDGEGVPIPAEGVQWLAARLIGLMVDHGLPRPKLYATEEGRVQAVWRPLPWRVEAEFDVVAHTVSLIALNVETKADDDADFNLNKAEGGRELLAFLHKYLSPVAEVTP